MNSTPTANRLHIGIFGRINAGKSSLINTLTSQDIAVVSPIAGTTTDPVYKSMEILPLGPVVIIDTPGIDDEGELGIKRIEKAREILRKTDMALLVVSDQNPFDKQEEALVNEFVKRGIPYIIVCNKTKPISETSTSGKSNSSNRNTVFNIQNKSYGFKDFNAPIVEVSAKTGEGIQNLLSQMAALKKEDDGQLHLVDGIIGRGDTAVLVTPIDKGAPKGRIILPQQQVLRDILDHNATALITKETELEKALEALALPPKIVITDSQAFPQVSKIVPNEMQLTSFSILFARQKGNLNLFYQSIKAIDALNDGDHVLIAEGCTHHRQEDDIGTVKIPNMLVKKANKKLIFEHTSGGFFDEDLSKYKLIIHCGACMLNKREMEYRQNQAFDANVPMVNYGMVLAFGTGILERAIKPFKNELI